MDTWSPQDITELRKSLKLTQAAFAETIGVTSVYVNYLEKGVRKPGRTLIILLNCIRQKVKRKRRKDGDVHGSKG